MSQRLPKRRAETRTLLPLTAAVGLFFASCSPLGTSPDAPTPHASSARVVRASEVQWEQLNPARGDQSPLAGTLFGDREGSGPTGFLLRPVDGFRSPPHLHNVSYRGVVLRGLIHNDDPSAADMWMPAGSFWTQPKGEVHITAALGEDALAYIEIEEGPYLVLPVEQAFDGGELPVNVHESNLVWVDPPGPSGALGGAKVAHVWGLPGDESWSGALVRLPAGFEGVLRGHGHTLGAAVIRGRPSYGASEDVEAGALEPGSYFSSQGPFRHRIACGSNEGCVVYLRVKGTWDVAAEPNER